MSLLKMVMPSFFQFLDLSLRECNFFLSLIKDCFKYIEFNYKFIFYSYDDIKLIYNNNEVHNSIYIL